MNTLENKTLKRYFTPAARKTGSGAYNQEIDNPFLMRLLKLFIFVLSLLPASPSIGQSRLQSPEAFLGYKLGDRFTPHHRVVDYLMHVADFSPNIGLHQYGVTNEGRPLYVVFVASPPNLSRLEEIRTNNLKLTGLAHGDLEGPVPTIVWLSYNVHGNESVGTEAAMATLYDLADSSNEATQRWLRNTLVILDPAINPDGRNRYVNWYNRVVGKRRNVNPDAIEHHEPWPGGRTNHYYFDLNRDWAWMTQKETLARMALFNDWMPHVHVDFHEQGVDSPYYFAPAAEPYHEFITDWQREFQTIIGRNHAKHFDREGWLYFTRQVFDLFYPGYGDTYPTYNGAIGMTYEQGGSGRAGLGILTAEGDTLTLHDRIAHHYTTALSTIEMASLHHDRVVEEFEAFFDAARSTPAGTYRSYVIKASSGAGRLSAMQDHLDRLGIEYGSVINARRAKGYNYRSGADEDFDISPGDLVISAFQPRSTILNVMFEPTPTLVDSITYDITAWALPYVYDVEAYATTERIDPDVAFLSPAQSSSASEERPYAYLIEWKDPNDVAFLSSLLQKNVRVRYAEKAFTIGGSSYAPGTLIITRTGNEKLGARLDSIVRETAGEFNVRATGVSTGFVDSGSDFGSRDVHYIKRPNVAVVTGSPVSSGGVGVLWHYFDQQIEYPVTLVEAGSLGSLELDKYDVLILPSGSYGKILSESRLDTLKTWIRSGGRLIAVQSAVKFFAGKEGFAIKQKKDDEEEDKEDEKSDDDEDRLKAYGNRRRDRVTRGIAGAIYRVSVDNTHPLAFGFDDISFSLKLRTSAPAYMKGTSAWNVGVLKKGSLVAGQVGYEAAPKIEGSLAYGVQNLGAGTIVYLVDDPLFRGFWYSGRLLVGNAVFMVGQR